ncbi:unnamed protein product [Mycena citricolor]|uniref:RING-type domain-containing protein n=1 Tax=Mycena citricolor TaxID=2018698 RepID=A0AAD2K7Z4_9AGAR|nr:unnamed protein product [Mycena citricolor]CAK5284214.1 unnamed protein product [Mycena citricolor]
MSTSTECYCAICDMYFCSIEERKMHIQRSTQHPECEYCQCRFLNKNVYRGHLVYSPHHHYCGSCDIEFKTGGGLRYHLEHAAVHRDDTDDDSDADGEVVECVAQLEWEDEMGQLSDSIDPEEDTPPDDSDTDSSWQEYDEYDYEDVDELAGPSREMCSTSSSSQSSEEQDSEGETRSRKFICPICSNTNPHSVACPPCGHMFCSSCIAEALQESRLCPLCCEAATDHRLRRVFVM